MEFNKAASLSNVLFVIIFFIAFLFLRSIAREEAR
jgi:multiple sugar transport system permease protein